MGAFAGWDMPIEYAGTLSEHRAVREAVGVFDLSHLGKVEVRGPGAYDTLQHALSNDLDRLTEEGAAQYTLCLSDDGGIGYELIVPGERAPALWDELFDRGEQLGAVPCGLGARDTLRLEMGYPLHGNDISTATDPFMARLGWAVRMDKPAFRGKPALLERKQSGPERLLVGLVATDRLIPRHGMAVLDPDDPDGRPIGEVTSGTFSPTLRHGIALAYVVPAFAKDGTGLLVDVRGRRCSTRVTRPPFVDAAAK